MERNCSHFQKLDSAPQQKIDSLSFEAIYHEGPLPHPEILEKYGKIDSSFPERIFKMAETTTESIVQERIFKTKAYTFGVMTGAVGFWVLGIISITSSVILILCGYGQYALAPLAIPAVLNFHEILDALNTLLGRNKKD